MSMDDNISLAMRAIEKGAFLFIKKPLTLEMLSYIWQHVVQESKGRYVISQGAGLWGMADRNPNMNIGEDDKGKRVDEGLDSAYNVMSHDGVKRRVCTEWTQELHEKFMHAVERLGEGSKISFYMILFLFFTCCL